MVTKKSIKSARLDTAALKNAILDVVDQREWVPYPSRQAREYEAPDNHGGHGHYTMAHPEIKGGRQSMSRTVTLEDVAEQFCVQDKTKALHGIREQFDEMMDKDKATSMFIEIMEEMDKLASAEGETPSPLDRITWAVKEAYIYGCLNMAETFMTAADMGYECLAGKKVGGD